MGPPGKGAEAVGRTWLRPLLDGARPGAGTRGRAARLGREVGQEVSGLSRRGPGLRDFGRESEMGEDPVDHTRILNGREQAHAAATGSRSISSLNKFNGNESPRLHLDDRFRKLNRTWSILYWVESLRFRPYPVSSRAKLHLKHSLSITLDKCRSVIEWLVGFDRCDGKLDTGRASNRWSSRYATDHNGASRTSDAGVPIPG